MSIDYEAVCFRCQKYQHIGQDMGCKKSLGYGSGDGEGADVAAQFVISHAQECGAVIVMDSNDVPPNFLCIPTNPWDSDEPGYGRGGVG